jgi:2-polyprenyl-3-methyl-5-hydroxy-6-metoxy-1,4-benzoquinol methylase
MWDKRSKKYDDAIKKHDSIYEKTIESSRELLNRSDLVLDFGCASGEISLDIASHVQRVHGIDTSGKMIELAKEKALKRQIDNIKFDKMEVYDSSLSNNSFSTIIAFSIFHLVDDAPKVLARLNDLITAGGVLITQTPCLGERGWVFRLLISLAQKVGFAPYIRSFTTTELESLVSSGGFEILKTEIWDEKNAIQWIVARKI